MNVRSEPVAAPRTDANGRVEPVSRFLHPLRRSMQAEFLQGFPRIPFRCGCGKATLAEYDTEASLAKTQERVRVAQVYGKR